MKKILIIAYYFPPLGGGGIQRPLKFCKHFPDFGFQPVVLTSKNGVGPIYDESLLDELNMYKNIKVYRTLSFEFGGLKKLFLGRKNKQNAEAEKITDLLLDQNPEIDKNHKKRKKKKVKINFSFFFQLLYNFFFSVQKKVCIPDDKILWALPAFFSAMKIIERENIEYIFVTIPPYSSFVLGALLKFFSKRKLIVDYRDPWNVPEKNKIINYFLEKNCLKAADGIICAVPRIDEFLENQFDLKKKSRGIVYNGYDADDYKNISFWKFEKYTLISGGDLYGIENIYFFKILEEFLLENKHIKDNFQLLICSNYSDWFEKYLEKSSIKSHIINLGPQPKAEYLKYLKGSNAAVIFAYADYKTTNHIQVHGRVFDYLFLKKNLLVIGKKNMELTEFLDSYSFEYEYAEYDRKEEVKNALKIMFDKRENPPQQINIGQFSRKKLTKKLSEFLLKNDK